jgi:diguanylate cyclase (GGDEF)-like protein
MKKTVKQENTPGEDQNYCILVVADQPENFRLIADILEDTDETYTLYQARNSKSAMKIVAQEHLDLILMDWETPQISGIDTVKQLKQNNSTKNIPIIMAAGSITSSDQLQIALEAGAVDYIHKPIDEIELTARVHSALLLGSSYKEIERRRDELERLNETLFLVNNSLEERNQELYRTVITDSLTQIYNRAFLMEALSKEFSKSKRHGLNLSCLMIDIDHFRELNHEHGYHVGDFIIKEIAARVKEIIRLEDIFGRYGGEEFLLILPNSKEEDARIAAEKVRFTIEKTQFEFNNLSLQVRLSVGVSNNRTDSPKTADELVQYAGRAMYEAKRTGRNRTVLYSQLTW